MAIYKEKTSNRGETAAQQKLGMGDEKVIVKCH